MDYEQLPRAALIQLLRQHDEARANVGKDGIIMSYTGRTAPWQIIRQVKPKLSRIIKKSSVGAERYQAANEIWDGENLSTMVTLYKYRGQIDLVLTDPPYNTGEDFRYNDKWDKDPNDPDLGDLVAKDDGSRHSKWLKFMTPRIWMMREMLRPGGVCAICIDHRELYRLGMLMDEIFGESNRLAIINWQKSYAPRSQKHVSTATEYVLVYAKDSDRAQTRLLSRTEEMDARYKNPDNDKDGVWKSSDASAAEVRETGTYAIQSPFTGAIYYPRDKRGHWANDAPVMKNWLEGWGSAYVRRDLKDGFAKAMVLKGSKFVDGEPVVGDKLVEQAREKARQRLEEGCWPTLYFGLKGETGPQLKSRLQEVRKGKVPMTYWADDDYITPMQIGSQSWDHEESGHSQTGINELDAVVGRGHEFTTVKPLKLFKKITQIWCRSDGVVLDPFAGSGTTGHAIVELNKETEASRKFILIEQGNTEKGDRYAKSLTAERVRRVITGDWAAGKRTPIPGGFRFIELRREHVDATAVNALAREEMLDLLLTSYWNKTEKAKSYLQRLPAGSHRHLFATNPKNEGFFLIWESPESDSVLDRNAFKEIVGEARAAGLAQRYHIYAAIAPYTGPGIEFYQIPDRVLEHIGFNPRADAYNNPEHADV
ncbi:site-specific DNA-methyltransferase [Castellaniella ginsengisoli]|uniref:site-specific DNA-methyltransferase (adenine-specific) n=1 Tax=Castellaniella ginsengisoli TaxID=546114 RepID=A0AB39DAT6_9BURK